MQKKYISIYQRSASPLPEKKDAEYNFLLNIGSFSNTLIFPEYFTFHTGVKSLDDLFSVSADSLKKLYRLSLEEEMHDTMIAGGTILFSKGDHLYNALPILLNGNLLAYYFKRNLFLNESLYLTSGEDQLTIEHPSTKENWGFLVCADVNNPSYFTDYKGVKYMAIPVASPFLPDDTEEARLDRDLSIFQNGAKLSGAVLFKCCLTGHTGTIDNKISPVNSGKVQGRSLIASPDGILIRATNINWQGVLSYSASDGHVKKVDYDL
ncbi:MAG: hypothetical protein OEV78_06985 [Spirochaetia bacterium]|nr:hypothetical protein [Spirochaetia bacterium]